MTAADWQEGGQAIYGVLTTLHLAGQALKRLPPERLPSPLKAAWPVTMREWWAYGSDPVTIRREGPTTEQVTALDTLADWLWSLEDRERRVVVARSLNMSWRAIMKRERRFGNGLSHEGWRNVYRGAVVKLAIKTA